jgi:hypothetical protein
MFLAACSGAPSTDDTATPDDTGDTEDTSDTEDTTDTEDTGETQDTDETGDTDDTQDTDDTDEEVVTPHDCLDNHGIFGLSSRWTYAWKNSSRTGTRSVTVSAYDNDTNSATVRVSSYWVDAGATFSETRVIDYVCDADYLYITAQTLDSTLDVGFGTPTVVADTYTYTEPDRVQVNHTLDAPSPTLWTRRTVGTMVDSAGTEHPFDVNGMCWLVQTDQAGYSPYLPDHYQCGTPPEYPDPEPTVTEEYRWEEGIGVVNDWDSRLTEHVP